jgi:nitrite reductase (NADH) large subunit
VNRVVRIRPTVEMPEATSDRGAHADAAARRHAVAMPVPDSILVVGGGIAGHAVCEQLTTRRPGARVTLVCAEPRLPYDRVSLGRLLAGEEAAALQLRPDDWYADRGIAVRTGVKVAALDPGAGTASLEGGEALRFDRAVLCTGSGALVPPIPGIRSEGVHVFRGPEDCAAILDAAVRGSRAAVIGGGLLGLEAAYGLAGLGCPVTVVHLMDRLMERQLDGPAAALLAPAIEALGIEVLLDHGTEEILIDARDRVRGLRFAGGRELACQLVVAAIGIRAETTLARNTGLAVERGIVVDDRMVSSHPRVLAVGECAQHRGVVHGIVAPIHDQAAVAARTLCGEDAVYAGSVPAAKLKVMGVDLVAAGLAEGPRAVAVADEVAGTYRKLIVQDGRAAGIVLLGDTRGTELLLDAVRTGAPVDDALGLLAEASQASAADLPDGAQVCNCNGVCKGAIVEAIREQGLGSTPEVVAVTRAGAGCGSCKPVVAELLAIERGSAVEAATYLCPCRRQTREELAGVVRDQAIESVSELSAACGAGRDCGACKPALAYLVSEVCGNRHREERHARYINDRVHANIQRDGTFSVIPRMRGGVTTPDELRRIADVADKYEVPMVKVTGGQRIDLLGVRKEQLPAIWEELGMPSGHAYAKAVRTVKTCVGTSFCRFGLGDSIELGVELERAMEGLYTPHKVKSSVSGCPRNCAESYVKDIGLVAVEGGWEVYVGGAAGATVRKGDLLARVDAPEDAKRLALAFLQHYREQAEYLERTYGYLERVGIEAVRAAVLDSEQQAALLERYRIAKSAADPDPWRERHAPVNPKQFAELDSESELVGPPTGAAR